MRKVGGKVILLTLLILSSILLTIVSSENKNLAYNLQYTNEVSSQTGIVDVQSWQINDNWMYEGYLDVGNLHHQEFPLISSIYLGHWKKQLLKYTYRKLIITLRLHTN